MTVELCFRAAVLDDVSTIRREITMRAVAYNTFSIVNDGLGNYEEAFAPGAFADHIAIRGDRVRVLRDHSPERVVGKVAQWQDSAVSLVVRAKVAPTVLGDETLALAEAGVLGPSVGFRDDVNGPGRAGQRLTRGKTFLREISLVPFQARDDAEVLSVREETVSVARPLLDEITLWLHQQREAHVS